MNFFQKTLRNARLVNLWGSSAGVGLWDVELHNADPLSPRSRWTWSAEFRRLLGFSSVDDFPDVVGSWADRLHPDDKARTFAVFGDALAGKTDRYDVVYRLRMRDDSWRWFRARGGVRRDNAGKAVRACGSLADIHEGHQREEMLQLWGSSAGVGLWNVVLADGDPLSPKSRWTWSAEFRRLLGFSSVDDFPDVVGSWADRLHPDDKAKIFAVFGDALEGRIDRYDVAYRLRMRDGSWRWFRATGGGAAGWERQGRACLRVTRRYSECGGAEVPHLCHGRPSGIPGRNLVLGCPAVVGVYRALRTGGRETGGPGHGNRRGHECHEFHGD